MKSKSYSGGMSIKQENSSTTYMESQPEFTKVHDLKDIEPFMGKIVCIRSKDFYLTEDKDLVFAYVDREWEKFRRYDGESILGAESYRYKLKGESCGRCALLKSNMPFEMRVASPTEIDMMKEGVEKKTHWFEYKFEDKPAFLYPQSTKPQ